MTAVDDGFDTVLLVDGRFMDVAAVTHEELLEVLHRGATVVGAASIGALRAAELRYQGMIGCGTAYSAILSEVITDDSELAVLMCPYTFSALTISLLDVRGILGLAHGAGVPMDALGDAFADARSMHFTERFSGRLGSLWARRGNLDQALSLLTGSGATVKSNDYRHALSVVAGGDSNSPAQPHPTQPLYTDKGIKRM